jgi:hypothetical protein
MEDLTKKDNENPIKNDNSNSPEAYEWKQLANAISMRSAQDNILWMQFGVFSAAHAVLLIALFAGGELPQGAVGIIITLIGFGLSFVSYKIQLRGLGHIDTLEILIDRLERRLIELKQLKDDLAISGHINIEDFNKYVGKGIQGRLWMKITNIVWIGLWVIGFGFVLGRLVC